MGVQHLSDEMPATSSFKGVMQRPAIGTLLVGDKVDKRMPDFYFVEHRRKKGAPVRQDFWAATVEFWQRPWVFRTASEFQKELGLLAHNFFPMDNSLSYSTWEVKAGTAKEVLQDYLDTELCKDTENTLLKLNWKPTSASKATSARFQKSTFFVVKHTMYNDIEAWRKFYENERVTLKAQQETLGLLNHQFRSITQDFMVSTWELREGIKIDILQDYLDNELGRGHMGSEVFQVYGTKDLHPFAESTR